MNLEIWHIWFISAMVLFILEIFLPSFVAACVGVGALAAGISAYLNLSIETQLIFFSIATVLSLFLIRPLMLRLSQKDTKSMATNVDAMVGKTGKVTETIDAKANTGRVQIDGDNWKAISESGEIIDEDQLVTVTKTESIILIVKQKN